MSNEKNFFETKETREQRVTRLYASPGGPLIGWLEDERLRRCQEPRHMAAEIGVPYGYINQLRNGFRSVQHIGDEFVVNCARYLGVPPVVVKLISGRIPMSDFNFPNESLEATVDRAMRQILRDPVARCVLPTDLTKLTLDAKQSLVAMYQECSGQDLFGGRQLPEMVRWLQRAATIHDESCAEALRGHRDVAVSD